MPNKDLKKLLSGGTLLENELLAARTKEKELLQKLKKATEREKLALIGFKAERKKRLTLEANKSTPSPENRSRDQRLLRAIVSLIPYEMMVFTYYDGIDPKTMKYIWFKHPHPKMFSSTVFIKDPTNDHLTNHLDKALLRETLATLNGIHDMSKPIEHVYSTPKMTIKNGIPTADQYLKEWRKATYISLNGKDNVFAFVQDITSLKLTEQAIKEKQLLKASLFDNLKEMVFVSTLDGHFYDFNSAASELLGYTESELMLIKIEKLYANPKDRVGFLKEINKRGYVKNYETLFMNKDGSKIPVTITATPIDIPGKGKLFQGVIRDISDLKHKEQLQGVLAVAASVMHGFSQPLHALNSILDCVSDDIDYFIEKADNALKGMIETNLEDSTINNYSQFLHDILSVPPDQKNPSLGQTKKDIKELKSICQDMVKLLNEIRTLTRRKEFTKVEYSKGSDMVKLNGMGGFDIDLD